MPEWTLLTRDGCSLCEEFMDELSELLGPAAAGKVRLVDVDADAETRRKYGNRIPVLLADGEMVCCYRLDRERIAPYLNAAE
jgi:hypothetical protein